ncbi:Asp-tRNA(Asn)/Glu-tRNA(Gln) amidotransferase GatCAB subunit A [Acinetobacter larvae]|uniref:Amidase n=1 Tax=Acinetobacter larvae TaxID=1789224 RepID=A0A1B2LX19_9GAMM|nr:Asp-tRNA(Asn)/Glu-tRNA(Gln) amidotransferase GatCAB subunit A [Acinetobacter larvae]AOA57502.1 amidase [Acinetobacter larvae]
MLDKSLLLLPVLELAKRIQSREVSSVDLTQLLLQHAQACNPTINAYISFRADKALAEAAQADAEIAQGQYRGVFHGIPMGIKDNIYLAGEVTTMASKIHQHFVADSDASVIARLKQAGAIIIGKLNMHEYAWGISNNSPHFGACHNPWNLDKIPGGSSGGSGAAVAAAMSTISLGTDTAGSIRIPSSACGLVGLKPTHGLVAKFGCFPLAWSLDHIGPMAKTVADAAAMLQVIAGYDPRDPTSQQVDIANYSAHLTADIAGKVIGINEEYFFHQVDQRIENLVRAQIAQLEAQGAIIKKVSIPALNHAEYTELITSLSEAAAIHHQDMQQRPDDFGDDIRLLFELGEIPTAVEYLHAQQLRQELKQQFAAIFAEVDVLIAPTLPILPPDIGSATVDLNGETVDLLNHIIRFTGPSNLTGFPALSMPCGIIDGQPVGLQIIGPAFQEAQVFHIAAAIERQQQFDYQYAARAYVEA